MSTPESLLVDAEMTAASRLSGMAKVRCLLALLCSHVAAPYAAARLIIRYQLQGDFEMVYALTAGAAIGVGGLLAWRQLLHLSSARKGLAVALLVVFWFVVSFALLALAAHSDITSVLLGTMWAGGTLWIAWTVWAWSLFRSRGILFGSLLAGMVAVPFWVLVEATGLRGDTRVEFAWRKPRAAGPAVTEANRVTSAGEVLWAGYLGAQRNAVLSNIALNEDWKQQSPEQLWLKDCGRGWSSFAVTETTIFGQEQLNEQDCVTARDRATGDILWSTPERRDGFRSGLGGDGPRATPALHPLEIDGQSTLVVLAVGPSGMLSCLEAATGTLLWKTDLMEQFPGEELIHGLCGSPLVVDDLVIVAPPADAGPCLVAFRADDGTLAWRCPSDWRASYSSPARMSICDRTQVVLHAGPGVVAVDPATGAILWQYEWTNEFGTNATQPLQVDGHPNDLFVATGYQGGVVRISVAAQDDGSFQVSELWSNRRTMKTRFCNIAQFGEVLVGLDNGILCAVDTQTGKRLWKKGRYGHGQMLRAGDQLLMMEENGDIRILKPDKQGHHPVGDGFQALDRKTWSHPVLVDDQLIVRNDQEIVCVRLPLEVPAQPVSE